MKTRAFVLERTGIQPTVEKVIYADANFPVFDFIYSVMFRSQGV